VNFDAAARTSANFNTDNLAREVAAGQIAFAALIALCVTLHPGLVLKVNEGGMSNYGVHAKTAAPYCVALLVPVVLCADVSRRAVATSVPSRRFIAMLRTYSGLLFLVLITTFPYTLNTGLKDLHVGAGILITLFESATSIWMYRAIHTLRTALVLQFFGLGLAILTFVGALHVLFVSQLVTGVPFAILLVRTTREEFRPPR
jgi:hypothetical protein